MGGREDTASPENGPFFFFFGTSEFPNGGSVMPPLPPHALRARGALAVPGKKSQSS